MNTKSVFVTFEKRKSDFRAKRWNILPIFCRPKHYSFPNRVQMEKKELKLILEDQSGGTWRRSFVQLPQGDNDLAEASGSKGSDGKKNKRRKIGGLQAQVIGAGGIIHRRKNKAPLFFFSVAVRRAKKHRRRTNRNFRFVKNAKWMSRKLSSIMEFYFFYDSPRIPNYRI